MPSGVWAASEYDKLHAYDAPTGQQPPRLFLCHQHERNSPQARICAGWAGCHDAANLLALRVALALGDITAATYEAALDYRSPVPLFDSGAQAADHGEQQLLQPGQATVEAIAKIRRRRRGIDADSHDEQTTPAVRQARALAVERGRRPRQ